MRLPPRIFGGHLGTAVSTLVDGQLSPQEAARAQEHLAGCASCRAEVQRERTLKRRLSTLSTHQPSARLVEVLRDAEHLAQPGPLPQPTPLSPPAPPPQPGPLSGDAWSLVGEMERRDRARRRLGLAVAGAGSASLVVLGVAAMGLPAGVQGRSPAASLDDSLPAATASSDAPSLPGLGLTPMPGLRPVDPVSWAHVLSGR